MKNKLPNGISIFGIYFIVDSLTQLFYKLALPSYYSWYSWIFHPSPPKAIFLRYIFSIIYRILELISGIGILLRKDDLRKFTLFLNCFLILIVYWKHPFYAVEKHSRAVIDAFYQHTNSQVLSHISITKFTWIVLAGLYATDIGIAAGAIYYFSRPYIKEHFKGY